VKFLLDMCVASNLLNKTLVDLGHDVLSAYAGYTTASDESLLELALQEDRILVTKDKDFGELVFSLRRPHPCIVRLDGMTVDEEAAAMQNLIAGFAPAMRERAIIVVTVSHVRVRTAVDN